MGSESESENEMIPCLDFDRETLKEGSEGWKAMSKKVIEACENHGCFLMNMCDDELVPNKGLKEEMFMCMEKLFDLPEEIKKRYVSPKAYGQIAMPPHTDKSTITILYQNDVQGLQVFNKAAGKWIDVKIPSNGSAVIIGDVLKVWSNGRLEAAKHRVVIRGGKVRYSFVFFVLPDEDMVIKVPPELVDEDNMYPLRYRPFKYGEYLQYRDRVPRDTDILETFTGV